MALEIAGGAALGTIFAALYDVVKIAIGKTVIQYKPLLGDLKFTLDSLRPRIIQQIGEHNLALGLPNDEIDGLQQQMEEGVKLVVKLSKLGMWDCGILCSCCNCKKPSYADKLVELDRSLRILLEILKLQEARDVKEALLLARKIHDKQDELDERLSDLVKVQQEAGLRAQQETNMREFSGSNNTQTMGHGQSEGNDVQRATLGTSFGVLLGAVIQAKDKTRMFKHILGDLKSTIDSLKPLIEEIAEYNKVLHLSKEELENFIIQMKKGAELVHKCSKIRKWASYNKKYEYTHKLLRLDESLQVLLSMLIVQLVRDVRESLISLSNFEAVIKLVEGKIEEGVKLVEESGVYSYQMIKLKLKVHVKWLSLQPVVAVDVLNVQGTRNGKETFDSTMNMKAAGKQIKGKNEEKKVDAMQSHFKCLSGCCFI